MSKIHCHASAMINSIRAVFCVPEPADVSVVSPLIRNHAVIGD